MNDIINMEQYEHSEVYFMWYYVYPPTEKIVSLPYYLHSIGLHELQPPIAKMNGYKYDQFFYNLRGSGTLILNGNRYDLPAQSGFFIPAHVPHEYYPTGDVWDIRWMAPGGSGLGVLYSFLGMEKGGMYPLADIAPLDIIMNRMHSELIKDKENGNVYASACIMEFIMEFARQAGNIKLKTVLSENENDIYAGHMKILKDYIEYHYMHHIALSELCELIDVSPQHLCRIFKYCVGMRPMEYIVHKRIDAAKELLINSSHSISDIAYWCGFENNNYFWKVFKKTEKMTPNEYRRRYHTVPK